MENVCLEIRSELSDYIHFLRSELEFKVLISALNVSAEANDVEKYLWLMRF